MKMPQIFKKVFLPHIKILCTLAILVQSYAGVIKEKKSLSTIQENCSGIPQWSSTAIYTGGMEVVYEEIKYRAKWWTTNQNPAQNSTSWLVWEPLGPCSDGGGDGNNNLPPEVTITSPVSGTSFTAGTIISVTANATDTDGTISSVQFFNNDQLIGEDTSSPYSISIPDLVEGTYTLSAIAIDNDNASTMSPEVILAIVAGDGSGGSGGSEDCDGLAAFIVGEIYTQDQEISNEGKKYRCDVPGWCSSTSGWAYAPGTGTYWEMAWTELGTCGTDGGNNIPPTISIATPSNGSTYTLGSTITINTDAFDSDGNIESIEFFNGNSSLGVDKNSPYTITFNATEERYSLTAVAIDNEGASTTSSVVNIQRESTDGGGNNDLPARILNGYWHNFQNGSGITPLRDVSSNWDVINISFAVPAVSETDGEIGFELDPVFSTINYTDADFKSDIQLLQSKGKKVIISIGGAEGTVRIATESAAEKFKSSMISIIDEYGFDGLDIDFEGQSLSLNLGDTDFKNPTTPLIVNTINAIRGVCDHYGDDFILTMAPETFFVQLGYSFYGGISEGADRRAGAYLPLIHALRDKLTFLQVQYYNSGPITALNDEFVSMGNSNFYVALVDMLLKGFPITNDPNNFFPALRQDQVLIGVPATVNAGGGFTGAEGVITAMKYLIEGQSFGGSYQLTQTYPNLRGVMSWSTNWDEFGGLTFSNQVRTYLDGLSSRSPSNIINKTKSTTTIELLTNPIEDGILNLNVTTEENISSLDLQIYNLAGIKVFEKEIKAKSIKNSIDISALNAGMYLYRISVNRKIIDGKLIIK